MTPEARAKEGARGYPIKIGEAEWLLPDALCAHSLDDLRDRMFDSSARTHTIQKHDVRIAGMVLLQFNYDLSMGEAADLVQSVEIKELADAVWAALIAPQTNDKNRTYSEWIRASLAANGLKPKEIAPELVAGVLEILVATGRTMPAAEFSTIAKYAAQRTAILEQTEW